MTEPEYGETTEKPKLEWLKITLIGMAGYLLGSFFPAGYVRYFIQSNLFPETLVYQEPKFDRSLLKSAIEVTPEQLTSTLDTNPSLFGQKFMDKPVKLTGVIKFFLEGSSNPEKLTLTLTTGGDYGTGIIMTFDDPKSPDVIALRKEKPVTAVCMATAISSDNVHLDHCEVAK
jgi:hypothetical protein